MEKDNMPKYIAIEGPIGVGKTPAARKIALIIIFYKFQKPIEQ